jgi:tripartite-type tricarboxylate transporter receptor subunit TctC
VSDPSRLSDDVVRDTGSMGVGRVARSGLNGYMLSIGNVQTHVFNALTQKLQYDALKDFAPISLIADTPFSNIARSTLPARDLKELGGWVRENATKATCGMVGLGGPAHMAAVLFQKQADVEFQIVPYRGGAQLAQDLVAGHIDLAIGPATNFLGLIRSGQVQAHAILATKRWPVALEIPTTDEAGIPGLYASFWHGLWLPKDTRTEIIAKLNNAVVESLADPMVRQRFADIGQDIWPSAEQSREALGAYQWTEIEKWRPVIEATGLKPE